MPRMYNRNPNGHICCECPYAGIPQSGSGLGEEFSFPKADRLGCTVNWAADVFLRAILDRNLTQSSIQIRIRVCILHRKSWLVHSYLARFHQTKLENKGSDAFLTNTSQFLGEESLESAKPLAILFLWSGVLTLESIERYLIYDP